MATPLRLPLTLLAWLLVLAAVAALALVIVIVVAGPHAGLLPRPLEAVVLAAGWLAVLVLPVLVARAVWRRLG